MTAKQMRYLYKIYQLSGQKPEILSADIARKLHVSKPSVVKMLTTLSGQNLVVKEHYGKIKLTREGIDRARAFEKRIRMLTLLIPKMGLDLQAEELYDSACSLADVLPPSAWERLERQELPEACGESEIM